MEKRPRIKCATCGKSRRYFRSKTQDWRCPWCDIVYDDELALKGKEKRICGCLNDKRTAHKVWIEGDSKIHECMNCGEAFSEKVGGN
jgi:hypothetical protein